MPRRLAQQFASQDLAQLTGQLLFTPPQRRHEQVQRAEALHDQVEPERNYPLDFVAFRITGYRLETGVTTLLVGRALSPDLRLLIDSLSRSAPLPITAEEPVETPPELAARLGVSAKTTARWRHQGLRWRWAQYPGQDRPRLVIPRAALDYFFRLHPQRLPQAQAFSRMDARTREHVIAKARKLARQESLSPFQVARRLAPQVDRSPETIRLLLENHDRKHPGDPIFPDYTAPLSQKERRIIFRASRRGIDIDRLAKRFSRSRNTVYRALRQERADRLRSLFVHFVELPIFARPDADEVILRSRLTDDMPLSDASSSPARPLSPLPAPAPAPAAADASAAADVTRPLTPDELPSPLRELYDQPRLARDDQRDMAVRMNYLKFKAVRLRDQLHPADPRALDMDQIEECLKAASAIRQALVHANLPVVLSTARRHVQGHEDGLLRLPGLLEIGNLVLIDAIEAYDIRRGRSMEWYITWRLMQQFLREQLKAETTLDDQSKHPLTRAHRRENAKLIFDRMLISAQAAGVELRVKSHPAAREDEP
ncbi:MAG: hypothetical protein IT443_10900 [Phycisphaeraceae bacterium]|nr:hypothetical protein [Phycisphaeraceae bacterium]